MEKIFNYDAGTAEDMAYGQGVKDLQDALTRNVEESMNDELIKRFVLALIKQSALEVHGEKYLKEKEKKRGCR